MKMYSVRNRGVQITDIFCPAKNIHVRYYIINFK